MKNDIKTQGIEPAGIRAEAVRDEPGKTSNISVVLVEPQSSGNVGSVARAMRNTGFTDLVLVNPCDYANNEAYSMACKADGVLRSATVYPDLSGVTSAFGVIIGTTRRLGKLRSPVFTLDEAVPMILDFASSNKVALLFGREDKGLKNEELPVCDILVEIPTHEDYPSVNLSHAVFTVCHHLYMSTHAKGPTIEVAPKEELEMMYEHMERVLRTLDYGSEGRVFLLEAIIRNFRRLFGRTGLMMKEVNMIRGIFTQIEERVK